MVFQNRKIYFMVFNEMKDKCGKKRLYMALFSQFQNEVRFHYETIILWGKL